MIDLIKLELAHKLLKKTQDKRWFIRHYVTEILTYDGKAEANSDSFMLLHPERYDEEFKSIDDLIAKLQELAKQKPKYEVGQEVFALKRRGIIGLMSGHIKKYDVNDNDYYVVFDGYGGYWLDEKKIYPSRESLIKAQIDYWESLKFEDAIEYVRKNHDGTIKNLAPKECQHESDGILKDNSGTFELGCHKCKKCGEFFDV